MAKDNEKSVEPMNPAAHDASPLRLLMIEDSQNDVDLCLRELRKARIEYQVDVVTSPWQFASKVRANNYDVILTDYNMPGWRGTEVLYILEDLRMDIPVIMVTGSLGEENAVECIKLGAKDYVLKDKLVRLPLAIRQAMESRGLREQRAKAEEALRDTEANFRLLFLNIPLPMYLFDEDTLEILEVNAAATRCFGYSAEEFSQLRLTDLRPAAENPRLLEYLKQTRRVATKIAGNGIYLRKDGSLFEGEVIGHSIEFAGRRGVLAVVQDVTERNRAQQKLAASENRMRAIIEAEPECVRVLDRQGLVLEMNAAGLAMMEADSVEQVSSAGIENMVVPEHRDVFRKLCEEVFAGKSGSLEYEMVGLQGAHRWLDTHAVPLRDEQGQVSALLGVTRDVTGRKLAQEALRESAARYKGLFENATYGIGTTTISGKFLDVNPALVAMLGYGSTTELLTANLDRDIFQSVRDRPALLEECRQSGHGETETEWKRRDGKKIQVRISARLVAGQKNTSEQLELAVEDVTERRALQRQLHQAQKFEAIGQLAGGIAHDFNNMIGAVLGWAELGIEDSPEDSPLRNHFKKIQNQGERAAALTRQLLAFARRQILEPRNLDLNQSVNEVVSLLEKVIGKDIELKTMLASDLEPVRCDPTQLEQVLMNLCLNARDAMPEGGRLVIESRNEVLDENYCRSYPYARPGAYAMLSISDTGTGMDAETLDRIFEPFFTTKGLGKGTGLGLATVYGIVKQHGGVIHVYSEVRQGTTFHVYFPASLTKDKAPAKEVTEEPLRGGSETILLAEDHEGLREIACETLSQLGYTVVVAIDGEEAVEKFEAHRDQMAMVLLDVVLPRMSGPEAYAKMCAIKADLPVIFATGYSAETAALDGVKENGALILHKPYSPKALARRVRETLDQAAQRRHSMA
jgi:two-component system cell cycle sensor histidine kinase/response regulator CckA